MTFGPRARVVPIMAVVAMAAVLLVLGGLQYRWSVEVSNAEASRMQETLERSLLNVRQDVNRELRTISVELDPGHPEPGEDLRKYSERLQHWRETAAHPALVSNLFVWSSNSDRLTHIEPGTGKFQKVDWPSELSDIHADLKDVSSHMSAAASVFGRRGHGHDDAMHFGRMPRPEGLHIRDHHPGGPGSMWAFSGNNPALIHPVFHPLNARGSAALQPMNWLIVQLDPAVLERVVIPEAFQRSFATVAERAYEVAVIGGGEKPEIIYSSDANFPALGNIHPDAALNLFGFAGPMRGPGGEFAPGVAFERDRRAPGPMQEIGMFSMGRDTRVWQLVAEHRAGSAEAAVAELRHRNLALGFGVLAVLAAAATTLIVSTQRASRLAQLQMDFVAGVSHELRTPLTVISSAAENIADGVVREPQQVEHYGSVIKQQAGQLTHLIEQILLFASRKENQLRYQLRAVEVSEVINLAVENTAELIKASGFVLDQHIDQHLPPVMANVQALSQCLQNLITNAAKYSQDSKWIGIRATLQQTARGPQVGISVLDQGMGIASAELKHIFEPFYRGAFAQEKQIHGSGLGLPLARSIVESMDGSLTVESEAGKGSCFTLHLPAHVASEVESERTPESQMIRVSPGLQ